MKLSRIPWVTAAAIGTALLAACATPRPFEPTVAVMPGPYKPFEVFQNDDRICRSFAQEQIGGQTPGGAIGESTATGAAVGTAVGAAAGALVGRGAGGAAVGAGAGLLLGASQGSASGTWSAYELQRLYNIAYEQCMYSRGNQIPGYAAPASAPIPPPPASSQFK